MYCRKCGTEQHLGQKFCPKCGEAFLDENGNPYLKGVRKDIQDVKDKMTSNVEEFSKQGKKFIDENILSLFYGKIEKLKSYNRKENKERISSYIKCFLNNPSKVRLLTKVVVCLFLLLLFVKTGLTLWSIVIGVALILGLFKGLPYINADDLKSQYLVMLACTTIMSTSIAILPEGEGLFHSKSVQDEFIESLNDPSTAYAISIHKITVNMGYGKFMTEVPEDFYQKEVSYIYYLIFYPDNKSAKYGKAVIRVLHTRWNK